MFPPVEALRPRADGLVAVGGDLEPHTLEEAYRKGLFPWDGRFPYPWYSPDPRCILRPSAFKAQPSLLKLDRQGRYKVTVDTAFEAVMKACARVPRRGQNGTWISLDTVRGYTALHRRGIAHSVEVWDAEQQLVGGLYGLALGEIFFGESMFALARDTSKLALLHLCRRLDAAGYALVDCQQDTPHLRSLGAETVPRAEYLAALAVGVEVPDRWPLVVGAPQAPS